jgi:hypothetical protein
MKAAIITTLQYYDLVFGDIMWRLKKLERLGIILKEKSKKPPPKKAR